MKMYKLIKYDLKCGFVYNRIKLIIGIFFVLLNCIYFQMMTDKLPLDDISIGDLIIFMFKGEPVFYLKTGNFPMPVIYLGFQIVIAALVGYYPNDDITGYGKQVFIRCQNKKKWWMSKIIWCTVTVLFFYLCTYVLIMIFSLFAGYDISFDYHKEIIINTNNIDVPVISPKTIILSGIIMPVIYSVVISLIQVFLSMISNAVISFIIVMVYNFMTVFFANKIFIGNYAMILRNTENSYPVFNPFWGLVISLILIVTVVLLGRIFINKKQLI